MHISKSNYKLGDSIYKSIDEITLESSNIITISSNLILELSSLFESIEDDITHEIMTEMGEINDFISKMLSFTKNELQEIKIKSKISNEKADKRKLKLLKLKEDNKKLNEKINELETDKKNLIINIDDISKELTDLYQKNKYFEKRDSLEKIDKKNNDMIREKYIKEINEMQRDMEILKEKNKKYENSVNKFKRMSTILEEKNKKLNNQLGTQTMQFINKIKEQNEQKNVINLLRLQNSEQSQQIKNYQIQIENLKIKNKTLEEKINTLNNTILTRKNSKIFLESNKKYKSKNSSKKLISNKKEKELNDKSEDNENENWKYKTFSNLNDLLANESDISTGKNSNKQPKTIKRFRKCSFDLDYFFEIYFNVYENFFF